MEYNKISKSNSIKSWSDEDKPIEKLLLKGASALSDSELIAILIRTGTREKTALDLAKELLKSVNYNLNDLGKKSVAELKKIKGIANVKAVTITAALELGRRRQAASSIDKPQLTSSKQVFDYVGALFRDKQQEEFWVIYLSSAKRVIAKNTLAIGTTSHVLVDTKIIFKIAIENLATSIILIHNHPSGKPRPSQYDLALTQKLKEAGKLINVDISDHLIIAGKEYYSFKDENIL